MFIEDRLMLKPFDAVTNIDVIELAAEAGRLRTEVDRLLKGEYICKRCGLRKDDEHPKTHDF